ncbi:MAG: Zn-ribbon domain-containing OB-fold protein [Acidimicrobiales bacterium]
MRFDLPSPDAETQPYWDAARDGTLLIKRCAACGRAHFYPRPFCPHCWSTDVAWEQASGRATLYTYSIVRRNDLPPFGERVPYVAAVVDLEEGPRMQTNLEGCAESDITIGMALQVAFRAETEEFTFPVFRPAP